METKPTQPPAYTAAEGQPQTQYNTPAQYGMQGGAPPPPPGYAPVATTQYVQQPGGPPPPPNFVQQPGVVVVTHQPIKLHSRYPVLVTCQHCHQAVTTQPRSEVGTITWLACGAMILFGFWLGCCLIPFCIPDLQDTYHECPNCKQTIDVYRPL
uniref:Lipopolysaccharide-induced tumor necrosis factor-alpha factor homolog n=1 Tax=Phallusia mammillata TaxID=59560 RepID=A0A6F9DKE5_9ASCI|nr:lipopolysaccharide-induced tumor necrosis factor-alpha factor homolog [Phallusia mammillata]